MGTRVVGADRSLRSKHIQLYTVLRVLLHNASSWNFEESGCFMSARSNYNAPGP